MASANLSVSKPTIFTHEGAPAVPIKPLQELRRSVLTCLLWEDTFYEKGSEIAKRVRELISQCDPVDVANLAIEAREKMYLRHVPLFLVRELARKKGNGTIVAATLEQVIQRPDEIAEYVAIYWQDGRKPLSAGSKRGLRKAFGKFNGHQLAKYRMEGRAVKLVDVLRMVRPKAKDEAQNEAFKALRAGTLISTDTWESKLSAGGDKKEVFEELLREKKLGGLAFLRNLRNMTTAKVDDSLIRERFRAGFNKVLPFRFLAAARYAPSFAAEISDAMINNIPPDTPRLEGKTIILVDVSGSMDVSLSAKSEMQRLDAAAGLAVLLREQCEKVQVFTFSSSLVEVPNHRGIPLANAIAGSQPHGSTMLGKALQALNFHFSADRLIVVTDEQSHDRIPETRFPVKYLINVAPYKNGVGYRNKWLHIDGFSERILDFIAAVEKGEF